MYKKYFALIILNLSMLSTAKAQFLDINLSYENRCFDTTFVALLNAKKIKYHISVHIPSEDSSSIVFYRKGGIVNRHSIDTLNIIPIHPDNNWRVGKTFTIFDFKDINLDGYDDMFVLRAVDAQSWIPSYDIWLYDKKVGKYFYSDDFSEKVYSDYELDEKNKTITSRWTGFSDRNENGSMKYKIDGDKLNLIEEIRLSADGLNNYVWTQKKLVNGNLEVVKQITKTLEQVERGE